VRLFVIFLCVFAVSQPSQAQFAIEKVDQSRLQFRGQGSTPWCFAFAEEQYLKDLICTGDDCEFNADRWVLSIFDIAKDHGFRSGKIYGEERVDFNMTQHLFGGSHLNFPFVGEREEVKLRASHCTLEREVFRLIRDPSINPLGIGMYQMLSGVYENLKQNGPPNFEAIIGEYERVLEQDAASESLRTSAEESLRLTRQAQATMQIPEMAEVYSVFEQIAVEVETSDEFIERVLSYSKCDDTVSIPGFKLEERLLTQVDEVSELLQDRLTIGPVMAGVCAEVLADGERGEQVCGGHAVTIKKQRPGFYLVVDSAFFSPEPANDDGSQWIPKHIVHLAIAKNGEHIMTAQTRYEQQIADANAAYDEEMAAIEAEFQQRMEELRTQFGGAMNEIESSLRDSVSAIMGWLRQSAFTAPEGDLKAHTIEFLTQYFEQTMQSDPGYYNSDRDLVDTRQLNQRILSRVLPLDLNSVDDLVQVEQVFLAAYSEAMQSIVQEGFQSATQPFTDGVLNEQGEFVLPLRRPPGNLKLNGNLSWLIQDKL
jgi:hypothetical protein